MEWVGSDLFSQWLIARLRAHSIAISSIMSVRGSRSGEVLAHAAREGGLGRCEALAEAQKHGLGIVAHNLSPLKTAVEAMLHALDALAGGEGDGPEVG